MQTKKFSISYYQHQLTQIYQQYDQNLPLKHVLLSLLKSCLPAVYIIKHYPTCNQLYPSAYYLTYRSLPEDLTHYYYHTHFPLRRFFDAKFFQKQLRKISSFGLLPVYNSSIT